MQAAPPAAARATVIDWVLVPPKGKLSRLLMPTSYEPRLYASRSFREGEELSAFKHDELLEVCIHTAGSGEFGGNAALSLRTPPPLKDKVSSRTGFQTRMRIFRFFLLLKKGFLLGVSSV